MNKARLARAEAAIALSFEGRLHAAKLDGDYSRFTMAELESLMGHKADLSALSDELIADVLNRAILRTGLTLSPPGANGEPEAFTEAEIARGAELVSTVTEAFTVGDLSDSDLRSLVGYCMQAGGEVTR
jgi:hypothetical protein